MAKGTQGRPRRAQIVAEAVAVCCPWCGDAQPNKDGSEMWLRQDFVGLDGKARLCVACDEPMFVSYEPKAMFQ